MDGEIDGWMDGLMDGWMDRYLNINDGYNQAFSKYSK